MGSGIRSLRASILILSLLSSLVCTYVEDEHADDPDLFHFVTRPDLKPPRWEITVYDQSQLSPGYWFLAPKQSQRRTIGMGEAWIGPAIYDQEGEVIWSGTSQLDSSNINDFRLNRIGSEQMLTMLDRDRRSGVLIDHHYRVSKVLEIVKEDEIHQLNGHEFKLVDNGKKVLVIKNQDARASKREKDAVGFHGDVCWGNYQKLVELDVETGEVVFEFDSHGRIGIDESNTYEGNENVPLWCNITWDFMHANSADKCGNGHYLFNARHTNTIYKISKDDGSIIWRLGGPKSDFDMGDIKFSRQHDIRIRNENETHVLISILDNAVGEDSAPSTHEFSRGLLIAVDVANMTASLVAQYDHPDRSLAPRRGNMQILDNGNVFMGWSERAQQSEYTEDGTLLMKARLATDWMGSYRNYKFEYVGRPLAKPDVHAAVYFGRRNHTRTRVYVSWNGDTEVRTWNLYETSASGDRAELIISARRTGFETYLEWPGYLSFVRLEGITEDGKICGVSDVVKTVEHPSDPEAELRDNEREPNMKQQVEYLTKSHQDL